MKKLLLLCVVSLFSSITLAQNTNLQDVIYLQNGSIIRGTIIEQIPGKSLKIETRDGNIFVYQMDEISKMTREQTQNRYGVANRTLRFQAKPKGYAGFVEAGYGFGVGRLSPDLSTEYRAANRFEIDIINGYQFNPYCFVGLGVGFNIFTNAEKNSISIPVFIQGRFNLLDKHTSPFFALNIGYNIDTRRGEVHKKSSYGTTTITYPGGIMLEPTVGIAHRLSNRTSITFGISYSLMQFNNKVTYEYYDETETEKVRNRPQAVRLKLGITF
ncbi:hypothetical protein [uncultured Rikenella sp.]|uniref:hypothetical protein n=1 Tax=uncultured Rikenella sp. TaxID=368003 RepID=UPI00272B61E1|nr:hypothetical protein [uncultured Rikenella sp.]